MKIRFEDSGLEIVRSSAGEGEGESLSDGLPCFLLSPGHDPKKTLRLGGRIQADGALLSGTEPQVLSDASPGGFNAIFSGRTSRLALTQCARCCHAVPG